MERSNEQIKIKEYEQAMGLLDHFRARVEAGEILSMMVICETASGEMEGGTTATQNTFAVAGCMLLWAVRRLGFVGFDDLRNMGKI